MIANYALLAKEIAMPYPECLKVDSKSSMFAKGTRE
jgi:hypothetical protein